jgi:hypothetical protein
MKLSKELSSSRTVVEAIMTKLQHLHHSVGMEKDSWLVLRLPYF